MRDLDDHELDRLSHGGPHRDDVPRASAAEATPIAPAAPYPSSAPFPPAAPVGQAEIKAPERASPPPELSTRATIGAVEPRAPSLAEALRRARLEHAEAARGTPESREKTDAERMRLLRERLQPVLAQLPRNCDLFDIVLTPGDHPRLFIDPYALVEFSQERGRYRFLQDTRQGRVELFENEHIDPMVESIAAYMARRLVETERSVTAANPKSAPTIASKNSTEPNQFHKLAHVQIDRDELRRRAAGAMRTYMFWLEHAARGVAYVLVFTLGLWIFRHLN